MFPATLMLASVVAFVPQSTDVQHVDASTPRDVQIQLARQAAPPEVGREATIYVLGPKGYEKAVEGKNGFSCIIDREFPDTMEQLKRSEEHTSELQSPLNLVSR